MKWDLPGTSQPEGGQWEYESDSAGDYVDVLGALSGLARKIFVLGNIAALWM